MRGDDVEAAATEIAAARPTAANLGWGVRRALVAWRMAASTNDPVPSLMECGRAALAEAAAIASEDAAASAAMARHGLSLVPPGARILTHCNTGQLVSAGEGTAFAVILAAHRAGRLDRLWVDETRPLLQGARLTAWEAGRAGIPHSVLADGAAASLMASGQVDLVLTGAVAIVRLARENPRWVYQRIVGELNGVGVAASATTVKKILREAGLGPAGSRGGISWRVFLRAQAQTMLAVDFVTVETISLQWLYVLFFIELGSRRVRLAGCTANPTGPWVAQQARQLAWTIQERPGSFRFLIRDRDNKFARDFDVVFASEGIRIIKTPERAPKANATAERFVRTIRAECLDWLLILNRRHLERVLRVFADHYTSHRPHRSLNLKPPDPVSPKAQVAPSPTALVQRRDRLGGLLHEYNLAA